jgi:hypothetical protein
LRELVLAVVVGRSLGARDLKGSEADWWERHDCLMRIGLKGLRVVDVRIFFAFTTPFINNQSHANGMFRSVVRNRRAKSIAKCLSRGDYVKP